MSDLKTLQQLLAEYDTAGLAQWLHGRTVAIWKRFDRRSGSDYCGRRLMLAGIDQ